MTASAQVSSDFRLIFDITGSIFSECDLIELSHDLKRNIPFLFFPCVGCILYRLALSC